MPLTGTALPKSPCIIPIKQVQLSPLVEEETETYRGKWLAPGHTSRRCPNQPVIGPSEPGFCTRTPPARVGIYPHFTDEDTRNPSSQACPVPSRRRLFCRAQVKVTKPSAPCSRRPKESGSPRRHTGDQRGLSGLCSQQRAPSKAAGWSPRGGAQGPGPVLWAGKSERDQAHAF